MAIPFLNHIDLTKSEIRRVSLHQTTTASVGTEKFTGQIIFDTGDSKAKYYDGTAWITMGDTDNYVDGASLSNNTLTLTRTGSLADLTVDLSSLDTTDNYVDGVSLSGSTLTLTRTGSLSDLTQDLSSIVPSDVVDGTGVAGQVAYWSDSDTITGENDFGWDATNNRLGIGVGLSPTANLDISRAVSSVASTLALTDTRASVKIKGSTTGDSQLTFSQGSSGTEQIQASNAAADAVKPLSLNPFGGDVYINLSDTGAGTTALLVMGGSTTQTSQINMKSNTGTNDGSIINADHKLTLRISSSATEQIVLDNSGHVHFKTYGSGNVTGTEAKNLSVTSAGKIIETTPITNTDTLQGIAAATDSDEKFVTFVETATGAQTGMSGANFKFNPGTDTLSVTNLIVSGTQTISNETVKVVENNTLQFEGPTGSNADTELNLTTATLTGSDKTVTLKNESGTIALISDIPTVNDATLTVEGTGVLGGTGTFTANDADDVTISITHDTVTTSATSSTASPGYGSTFTAIDSITTSNEGHITAVNTKTVTLPASDNTDTNTQLSTAAALIDVSVMDDTPSHRTASFTHSLGSKNLIVQMYDVVTGQVVYADVDHTSTSAISITFAAIPTNDVRVVVIDAKNGLTDKTVSYS